MSFILFRQILPGAAGLPSVFDQLERVWWDMAGTPFPRQIAALEAAFGTGRLLYGSDYCWTPAPVALAQIASIDAAAPPAGSGS